MASQVSQQRIAGPKRSRPAPRPSDPVLLRLGERIRSLRAIRGMSRKSLAQDAGVSERFLADLEMGVGNASVLLLNRLAEALALALADILGGNEERRADLTLSLQEVCRCVADIDKIDIDTYFDLGHVSANFGKTELAAFDEWLEKSTPRKRRIEISLPSFRDVPEMLVGTDRLATLHRCYAHDFSARLPIRLFPIPFRHPGLVQIAQWHRLRGQDPGIQWLIAALRRHAARIGSASPNEATDL